MMEIMITAIITALATALIMLCAIAAASVAEDNEKEKGNEELKHKIMILEIRINAISEAMNHRGNTLYNLSLKDKELEEKIKKLESKKTSKNK